MHSGAGLTNNILLSCSNMQSASGHSDSMDYEWNNLGAFEEDQEDSSFGTVLTELISF